jgi:hypothetical protein
MNRANSFVTELATADSTRELTFEKSHPGWVYISWDGDQAAFIDSEQLYRREYQGRSEAMVMMPAGTHTLTGTGGSLGTPIIRSTPQLMYCRVGAGVNIPEFGPYDWSFLEKHVLPHVNTVVAGGGADQIELSEEWKRRGGRWIIERGLPAVRDAECDPEDAAAKIAAHLLDDPTKPSGVLLDEFFSGNAPSYPGYTEMVKLLASDKRLDGLAIHPYVGGHYPDTNDWNVGDPSGPDNSTLFYRECFDNGWWVSWERYLPEFRYAEDASAFMDERLLDPIRRWRSFYPDAQRSMIVAFGYLTTTETINNHPGVDFKVFMDMEFQYLATRNEFKDIAGVMEYLSCYTDEETARWAPRLYRHYCIEGNTDLLTERLGWRYIPEMIRNPDFEYFWESWEFPIVPQERAMRVCHVEKYSHLQGRMPTVTVGDTALVMRRRGEAQNTISQPLRNVKPGQFYSLKLITGDYQDLMKGRSVSQKHSVRISLTGDVEIVPERTFQAIVPNNYAHTIGEFTATHNFYFNWHIVVFKATGRDIRLTISDWLSDDQPDGPIGQELMYNCIEVQPYWMGDESV